MSDNSNLHRAKKAKNDEFYTQYEDIEKEMVHYIKHFAGQIIYCNCDDPSWSNFWKFFHEHFTEYKLKRLISTHYEKDGSPSYATIYEGGNDKKIDDCLRVDLKGNGDFRSEECIGFLKKSNIVVTNPPFSLFREYIAQLMEHRKKFIVMGNKNAITYKDVFIYIKDNKLWLGASIHSGGRLFRVPNTYRQSKNFIYDNKGNKYVEFPGARWFTNLDYNQRHRSLWSTVKTICKYSKDKYPKYDNYNAINIDNSSEIPINYFGVMGVPITWLDKYNPDEFIILGNEDLLNIPKGRGYIKGQRKYSRLFVQRRKVE